MISKLVSPQFYLIEPKCDRKLHFLSKYKQEIVTIVSQLTMTKNKLTNFSQNYEI